jgi:hypothetical protein
VADGLNMKGSLNSGTKSLKHAAQRLSGLAIRRECGQPVDDISRDKNPAKADIDSSRANILTGTTGGREDGDACREAAPPQPITQA